MSELHFRVRERQRERERERERERNVVQNEMKKNNLKDKRKKLH